jgi:uncharacterized protein YigA (DUF484 family)
MNSEQVAQYLQDNPQFFEEYAPMLADIVIPHPHGGRAVPISERQLITLREKNRMLEAKLKELIQFGEENDAIGDKFHRLTLSVIAAQDFESVLNALYSHLKENFEIPHAALRLWGKVPEHSYQTEYTATTQELRDYAEKLKQPYCSHQAIFDIPSWFGDAIENLNSFAFIVLRTEKTFGLLVLASEDPQRFYPEMGTLYLQRLAEVVSMALPRHLKET